VIATNIDFAFIVQAISWDFNINRLERYLTICNSSDIEPVIVLTKIDLIDKEAVEGLLEGIRRRIKQVKVICISNLTQEGYEAIQAIIEKGKTYCMLGSSGVGKSTLINNLSGKALMQTGSISDSTSKGRHVTSHRELVVLDKGGILIDNPGMREVGIADTADGLEITFDTIIGLAENCRFKDCTHTSEVGCAVLEAIANGELNDAAYENYMKMKREKMHYESTVAEKRQREKQFGKILKDYKKGNWK
ncbi:MAG: ribosome small subunit-dependent GTPase A, partial [Verrucomicrobia bacterium]|nr:ribosome small subunit-dependent GTPase A [Prolixibacteraceae bacterium]